MVTGEMLETTDSLGKGTLRGAMGSQVIPIRVDKSEGVQVLLVSPQRAIYRQMIFILALSALLILFVALALFFQLRLLIKERHIRQLQTDFSHALIHDMATPLQTIYQINALMKNDKVAADKEKRSRFLDVAQQQIVSLQALIDRVLTVARSEQSRLALTTSRVNIKSMIEQLTDKFAVQAQKEVTFTTHFSPESIYIMADRTLLQNAVGNLVDNAIKYSGPSVQIDIDCRLKENGLYIRVEDNGYGISAKDQAVIFAKFERGIAVKRQEAKGFGLGLAYVKSVAEAHGGTVNLHSKKGEGTLFELFLPKSYQPVRDSESTNE